MMKTKIILFSLFLLIAFSCKKDSPKTLGLSDGLISYFNFDDNLNDLQSNMNEGVGNAAFVVRNEGKALAFNGIDQKIIFSKKNPTSSKQITISFWLNYNSGKVFLMSNAVPSFTPTDFSFEVTSGALLFLVNTSTDSNGTLAFLSSGANQWTHIVAIYDGSLAKLYVDGVFKSSWDAPGVLSALDDDITLGYSSEGYWKGMIDELYIYNRVLSPEEVTQLYNLNN